MFRKKYEGATVPVRADKARVGQTVVDITDGTIRPRRGEWPTIAHITPEVLPGDGLVFHIALSDHPGAAFPLRPHETVTVAT